MKTTVRKLIVLYIFIALLFLTYVLGKIVGADIIKYINLMN
jgi:hypothetical protein